MMMTGQVLGSGLARPAAGPGVTYRLIRPEKSVANLATIAQEARRWGATAARFQLTARQHQLSPDLGRRAEFAEAVLATAGENLRIGACCLLLAQADDGRILGVATYGLLPRQEGAINLVAIDPEHLAGSPGTAQLRGIGTAIVAAVSRELLSQGVTIVYLHPLDEAAARFWRGRGFVACGAGRLCIRGRAGVEGLRGSCELKPDCPDTGDCLVCGRPEDVAAMRVRA